MIQFVLVHLQLVMDLLSSFPMATYLGRYYTGMDCRMTSLISPLEGKVLDLSMKM